MNPIQALGGFALEGVLHWLCTLAYITPLRHRSWYKLRAALALPAFLLTAIGSAPLWQGNMLWARNIVTGVAIALVVYLCASVGWTGAVYCAMMILVSVQAVHELWMALQGLLLQGHTLPWTSYWWVELLFSALLYLVVWRTIARRAVFWNGYETGVIQMILAVLLVVLFMVLFILLQQGVSVVTWNENIVLPAVLGQLNCLAVLGLQNELFVKNAVQKELDTMNLLYEKRTEQYARARRGVDLINRRCHALKVELARLRAAGGQPDPHAEEAVQALESMVRTGNEVLDTVLTEKSFLCEELGISLNCVADGKMLSFLEMSDLYVLFSELLENAFQAVLQFAEPKRRLVEVLVYRRQGFVVVRVSNPVAEPPVIVRGLPRPKPGEPALGLKTVRRISQRYQGRLSCDVQDAVFTLRIVFPAP